jgi:hypothetical protein
MKKDVEAIIEMPSMEKWMAFLFVKQNPGMYHAIYGKENNIENTS